MPFYNVTAEEAKSISEFTERRTARKLMTLVGDQTGAVEMREESIAQSTTPYLDHVVSVVEAVLRRYAAACTAAVDRSREENPENEEQPPSSSAGASAAAHSSGERLFPFPSLFLHTPRQLVDMQDAVAGAAREHPSWPVLPSATHNSQGGSASISNVHCTPSMPPMGLLYTQARTSAAEAAAVKWEGAEGGESEGGESGVRGSSGCAADSSDGGGSKHTTDALTMVPVPLPCEVVHQFPPELHRSAAAVLLNAHLEAARRMVNVSLTPPAFASPASLQEMVQVVLQAEAALVVAAPPPPTTTPQDVDERPVGMSPTEASVTEEAQMAPFLLSPDATSCVLVACRVQLHPSIQRLVEAMERQRMLSTLRSTFSSDDGACLMFLRACLRTATACMIHLDGTAGVTEALQQMVWGSAVPAFIHAVHRHCCQSHASSAASPADALRLLQETLNAVYRAVKSAPAHETEAAGLSLQDPGSLLHVEWYVVGGVRITKHAAPVLEAVFHVFFPRRPPPSASASPTSPASSVLLKEEVELHSLLGLSPGPQEPLTLRIAHRLREGGQCFWSFNTTFQPWCVDPNANQRYAYPMTWGLLLSVATGHCWPATVQQGTRMIPMCEVRQIAAGFGYRWITPLVSDATEKRASDKPVEHREQRTGPDNYGREDGDRAAGLIVMRNAVPSQTVMQRMNKLASTVPPEQRLWSAFRVYSAFSKESPVSEDDDPPSSSRMSLSLASYVRTLIDRQEAWWARRTSAPTAEAAIHPSPPQRTLPLLIRGRCAANSADSDDDRSKGRVTCWERLQFDAVKDALAQPKVSFLGSSTTPHCEPPDFCDLMRNQLLWRASVSSADVFVDGTDGLYID
ncbi:hypothetical protein ABL78_8215 [Leptomonas seymouri]|uniref:Uncharacterized protein n=1 Tax=Leptomonas seymouri TaxID=5684 RepID=A0A0N1HZH0_LEPSE|nr:hypothetical protein ABL78_8215 [Leptomonas seymouri]|eukprot:KPI82773.1 hypothetical protein ABL78_8215 [Leptomonas seymouri]